MSSLPDFSRTLRAVGTAFGKPAAFIGHSLGTAAAILADEVAVRPDRFILIAPLLRIVQSARLFVRAMGAPASVHPGFDAYVERTAGMPFTAFELEPKLAQMNRPALIIHDRADRETPWKDGERFAKAWPGARLFSTEGLGHNRLVDHPTVINEAMGFLADIAPRKANTEQASIQG